jgi:hypothetical protein
MTAPGPVTSVTGAFTRPARDRLDGTIRRATTQEQTVKESRRLRLYLVPPLLLVLALAGWIRSYLPRDFHFATADGAIILSFTEGYWARHIGNPEFHSRWASIIDDARKNATTSNKFLGLEYLAGARTRNSPNSAYAMIAVPFAYPVTLLAAASVWSFTAAHLRRKRSGPHACEQCGYDLRASPGRCPECGTVPSRVQG